MTTIISAPKTKLFKLLWASEESSNDVEQFIEFHELTLSLRRDPHYVEKRPHLSIPERMRAQNILTGPLSGPQRITVAPYVFENTGKSMVMIIHLGNELSSHSGMVHGGLLATLLDETLVRCSGTAFEKKVAVTANLNIDFRNPAMVNSYFVLTAEVSQLQGRKAWLNGRIETLPSQGDDYTLIAEAKALFIEPRNADVSSSSGPPPWMPVIYMTLAVNIELL
ncbi:thioesterase family protein [Penicillium malachiteum]|uniref:thioesterase family protein n=1 Tax=Penicillium malachiteum TaxID=1324776 RepID=UPI002548B033|nr:thioesterase family protein [Penicillium malachiteum]KAJ5736778.1 thioesterase family protein [Penicillium malachiteum]